MTESFKSGYREYSPCLVNMKDHRPPSCTLQFHLQMWHRTLSPPCRIQPTKWGNTGKKESIFLSSKLCEERWKRRPCTLACLTCKYHHKQHSVAQNPVAQNKQCIINKEHDAHSRSIVFNFDWPVVAHQAHIVDRYMASLLESVQETLHIAKSTQYVRKHIQTIRKHTSLSIATTRKQLWPRLTFILFTVSSAGSSRYRSSLWRASACPTKSTVSSLKPYFLKYTWNMELPLCRKRLVICHCKICNPKMCHWHVDHGPTCHEHNKWIRTCIGWILHENIRETCKRNIFAQHIE